MRFEPRALELRVAGEGSTLNFRGHGIVYDRWTEIFDYWYGSYMERIGVGAAAGNLEDDIRLLINHDANLVLARTSSGTLRLSEDATGVLSEAELAPTTYARDLAVLLDRGDVSQMSFSFVPADEEWDVRPDGTWLRTITRFEQIYDMSIVTYPAYEESDAGMRGRFRIPRGATETDRNGVLEQANRVALAAQEQQHHEAAARRYRMEV